MSPKYHNLEIALIYFLLLIPWPHTNVIKMLCSRDNSRLVRKIVRSKWTPILDKYQVKLPLECPLHPFRDLFAPRQDAKKRDRPTQWTCRLCGKSFYQEKFLDLHFETRHKTIINEAEDSVCLADFCDVMRCEVFQTEEASSLKFGDQHTITDIEVWGDSLGQNSALAKANAAYLSLIPRSRTSKTGATRAEKVQNRQLLQDTDSQSSEQIDADSSKPASSAKSKDNESFLKKLSKGVISSGKMLAQTPASTHEASDSTESEHKHAEGEFDVEQENTTASEESESSDGNAQNKKHNNDENNNSNNNNNNSDDDDNNNVSTNAQKARANCKAEELSKLKTRCDLLLHRCIGSLLLSMTDQSFKEMEEEMNKAVCWYLTCDRYWEDGPLEPRAFPWGLIVILIFVLSTGICFCYYIIWILFDSEETTINANHQLGVGGGGAYMLHHSQPYQPDYLTAGSSSSSGVGVVGGIHGPIMVQHQPQQIQQQQQQHQQQQQAAAAAAYYYQQQHDLYPEPPQYEYHRHSPRHYIADQRQPAQGTPTVSAVTAATTVAGANLGVGVGGIGVLHQQHSNTNTPLHHQRHPTNLAYQQDILDLRDYTSSRPSTTTAVSSSRVGPNVSAPSIATSATVLPTSSGSMSGDTMISGSTGAVGVGVGGVGTGRHYNTHPRPLESRRHVGASQQSLRASSSTHEIIQNEVGQNEQYIYVTYPPDLKKRFFEKYE